MIRENKITSFQKSLHKLGIKISLDQIRKLERAGIVLCSHHSISKHREFTEEQFKKSIRNIIYYYFHTPLEVIRADNPETLKLRAKQIIKAVKSII